MAATADSPLRICYLNPLAPPASGSRAERTVRLSHALIQRGHQVTVVRARLPSALTPRDPALAQELEHSGAKLVELDAGDSIAALKYPSEGSMLAQRLRRLVVEFVWPDWWAGFGVAAARWIAGHAGQFDVLLASAFPWTSVLVAHEVRRATGLPWVADYGDPWSLRHGRGGWRRSVDYVVERHLLSTAAAVLVTTEPTRTAFVTQHLATAERCHVVPAGVVLQSPPESHDGPLVLLHAGAVYGPRAAVGPFLAALREFESRAPDALRLIWCGTLDDPESSAAVRAQADEYHRYLPQGELALRERQSGAHVIFGNVGGVQIPAKVWRALGSQRPVLVIAADHSDPLRSLPELAGRGVICDNTPAAIGDGLRQLARLRGQFAHSDATRPPLPTWSSRAELVERILAAVRAEPARVARAGWRSIGYSICGTLAGLRWWARLS